MCGKYLTDHDNVVLLGPPGTGKPPPAIALDLLARPRVERVCGGAASGGLADMYWLSSTTANIYPLDSELET